MRVGLFGVLLLACGTGKPQHSAVPEHPQVNFGLVMPAGDQLPDAPVVALPATALDTLPGKVDLSPWFPPPGNQHQQFSCAAWAWAYGVQSYCSNRRNNRLGQRTGVADPDHAYSPAYLFSLFKQTADSMPCDMGVYLTNFMGFCRYAGLCTMSEVPYDTSITGCSVQVPLTAMSMGMSLAARGLVPLPTRLSQHDLPQWKAHLAAGEALMVLFIVDSVSFCAAGFEAAREQRPFTWDLSTFDGKKSGSHAMTCAGYDDSDSTLLVMNSFGQNWGTQGYVKIPYANVRKKSTGAYAFPIHGPGKVPHFSAKPVADSLRTGPGRSDIVMAKGEYVIVNGVKLILTDRTANGVFAMAAVSTVGSNDPPYVVKMQEHSSWTFYNAGLSITFTWSRAGGSDTHVVFQAISTPVGEDPAVRAIQQQPRVEVDP